MDQARNDDIASDLAYVRALAEEGAHAPLVGGRYFVVWGVLMGVSSLFVYFNAIGWIAVGSAGYIAPWFIALGVGWIFSFAMRGAVSVKPGAMTLGNKTAASVWFAVGIIMTLFFVGVLFAHDDYVAYGVPSYFLFSMLFPIGFGFYGVAFYAMATASRTEWLRYFAYLSWVFAAASLFFMATSVQFLVGAVGLFLCAAAPGVILMRREPANIV